MRLTIGAVFAEAGALLRREHALLVPVVAVFHFLPVFALGLFIGQPEKVESIADLLNWWSDKVGWLFAIELTIWFGSATVLVLLLDPARPPVGAALGRALRLMPRYVLAALLASLACYAGLFLLLLPGFYVIGRTFVTGAVVVAEPHVGAADAVARSFALTRNNGWLLFGAVAMLFFAGQLLIAIFGDSGGVFPGDLIHQSIKAVLVAIGAVISAAVALGLLLLQVAAYRLLSSPSSGM